MHLQLDSAIRVGDIVSTAVFLITLKTLKICLENFYLNYVLVF